MSEPTTHKPRKKRRVYYADDNSYRITKAAAAVIGETLTEFVGTAVRDRIDLSFSDEQKNLLFRHQSPV